MVGGRDLHRHAHGQSDACPGSIAQLEPAHVGAAAGLLRPHVGREEVADRRVPAADQAGALAVGVRLVGTETEPLGLLQAGHQLQHRAHAGQVVQPGRDERLLGDVDGTPGQRREDLPVSHVMGADGDLAPDDDDGLHRARPAQDRGAGRPGRLPPNATRYPRSDRCPSVLARAPGAGLTPAADVSGSRSASSSIGARPSAAAAAAGGASSAASASCPQQTSAPAGAQGSSAAVSKRTVSHRSPAASPPRPAFSQPSRATSASLAGTDAHQGRQLAGPFHRAVRADELPATAQPAQVAERLPVGDANVAVDEQRPSRAPVRRGTGPRAGLAWACRPARSDHPCRSSPSLGWSPKSPPYAQRVRPSGSVCTRP